MTDFLARLAPKRFATYPVSVRSLEPRWNSRALGKVERLAAVGDLRRYKMLDAGRIVAILEHGRRHAAESWLALARVEDGIARGRKLVVQLVETF